MDEPVPKDPRGTIESVLADTEFMQKDAEFTKRFAKTEEYQDVYESKVASSLLASRMIGNLYTASLYLGFRSTLEFEFQKGVDLEGKRFGFASYGSGSSAMVFSGIIMPEYKSTVKDMNIEAELGQRKKTTSPLPPPGSRPVTSIAGFFYPGVFPGLYMDPEKVVWGT